MTLRCFLFCSDEGTSDLIRQVLTALGVEGEACSAPTTAVEKVANDPFHIVVIDWDQQPEAGLVLSASRERKPADRPLNLAIVSDDASVPKALQAGANSILRKPLLVNQVTDTLTTARDLIRSRFESTPKAQAAAASAASPSNPPEGLKSEHEKLRAGEFLQSAPLNPGAQFETESEIPVSFDQTVAEPVDALKDLETVAAAAPPPPAPEPEGPRGLEWYLKKKGLQSVYQGGAVAAAAAPAPASAPAPPQNGNPDLIGFDQSPSTSGPPPISGETTPPSEVPDASEQKQEAALFSYIAGQGERTEAPPSRFRIGKTAIFAASVLAAIAIVSAPQAPWHSRLKIVIAKGARSLHTWLHPQPVTAVAQAPTSYEDFGRPGDEYKLPAAEPIPDATTDPSQIQVVPEVDPTAKKPTTDGSAPDPTTAPVGATPPSVPDTSKSPAVQVQESPQATPPAVPVPVTTVAPPTTNVATSTPPPVIHTETPAVLAAPAPTSVPSSITPVPKAQPVPYVPPATKVPSSLQSQMAVMVPDASGNKPLDAAMPAIEPVNVPEQTERTLLTDQPAISYPASAKGQQGTVILEVLIGRDGTVQDAKFVQGSLAFARTAIDGVRQWRFKPYTMNGRPVSVQTILTIKFKPAQ